MTLTKYQRGVPMEGWNDCPPLLVSKLNSSSASLGSRKSSVSTSIIEKDVANTSLNSDNVDTIDLPPMIEEMCKSSTKLSPTMLIQLKTKLINNISKLGENEKTFVYDICSQLKDKEDSDILKGQIIEFMMINDGVSSWCVPLKKIIENMQ